MQNIEHWTVTPKLIILATITAAYLIALEIYSYVVQHRFAKALQRTD